MDDNKFESVYSSKVKAGKRRTYFFDVRKTKGEDYYITLTESTKRYNGDGYDRHKIFLYKEDFDRFQQSLNEVVDHIKTELMPDYDYEEYTRRQEEWEAKIAEEDAAAENAESDADDESSTVDSSSDESSSDDSDSDDTSNGDSSDDSATAAEDDMAW